MKEYLNSILTYNLNTGIKILGYSIIIPYRDRKEHLEMLLPALFEKFKDEDYEIIVSEQDDDKSFSIAKVYSVAILNSKYDNLIFQQVDYIPTKDVDYSIGDYECVLPCQRGIFLDSHNTGLRPIYDIPSGYRAWNNKIDESFYGGVLCITRDALDKVNGFNVLYDGWGNEDEDFRERIKFHNINVNRNKVGTFYCLHHRDNGDFNINKKESEDFIKGRKIYKNYQDFLKIGYKNLKFNSKKEIINIQGKEIIWIKSNEFEVIVDEGKK